VVYAVAMCLFVHLCVCLSVTRWYCVERRSLSLRNQRDILAQNL